MRRPLRNLIHRQLKKRAEDAGYPPSEVDAALFELESERPLLDWLLNGGFEKLLEMLLTILALFAKEKEGSGGAPGT